MKLAQEKYKAAVRKRIELFLCANHVWHGGTACARPLTIVCTSCSKTVGPDDVEEDPPFTKCPHGCDSILAVRDCLCLSHREEIDKRHAAIDRHRAALIKRNLCPDCGKDHPHPDRSCFYTFFREECCQTRKVTKEIVCIKRPPPEYADWLSHRIFVLHQADADDWTAFWLSNQERLNPGWERNEKEVQGYLAQSRRSVIRVKRKPGKWKSGLE